MKAIVLILLLCVVGVFSHAVLLQPRAWWKTASRTRPCGGAQYNPIPSATWSVGSRQMWKWWVIAGDGIGVVTGKLNLLGNTNFNHAQVVNLTVEQPERGFRSQGTFFPNITVPNVKCLGPNGTCTLQVSSNGGGGWYSCATINITCAGCDAGKPISGDKCLKAQNLNFCDIKNNQQVLVPLGQTPDEIDDLVAQTFRQNHPNPDVFINGNSSECMASYREMLCELYLTPCGNSTSSYTQQQCDNAIYKQCQLNDLHKDLYDCTVFPLGASNSDSSSVSSLSSSLFVSPILLFLSFFILLFLWV